MGVEGTLSAGPGLSAGLSGLRPRSAGPAEFELCWLFLRPDTQNMAVAFTIIYRRYQAKHSKCI